MSADLSVELIQSRSHARLLRSRWWLIVPLLVFFIAFFVIPVVLLFASSLNPPAVGVVALQPELTLQNFVRVFSRSMFYMSALRSVLIAATVALLTLVVAYPMAYVIAKTRNVARNTFLTILVLIAMQLDMVIRLYGMMVILGDNGLINQLLLLAGLIAEPLPLMYNTLGVILGLIQFSLPFMILSLVGVIAGIDPSLEEAARSLGASRRTAFFKITLPMSMPGIVAGTLLVFALSISSYIVPALMGGFKVGVIPIHIYQQVAEMARFQFGAAVAVTLFVISLVAILFYLRFGVRKSGGLA